MTNLVLPLLGLALLVGQEPGDEPDVNPGSLPLAAQYGFLEPEIYKLDVQLRNLITRDVDQDGKLDIVVVNNFKNRIDILSQRKAPATKSDEPEADEANEIPNDWRLHHRKLPVTRAMGSLEVRDVNSDNLADLVYLAEPPGLYVDYQRAGGEFVRGREFAVADAVTNVWSIDIADVNSDGRNDIAFLGKQSLYLVLQRADGGLDDPKKYPLAQEGASLVRILDFDEDGANDVIYLTDDDDFPVRIRFQNKEHRLGPERRFEIDRPRGISYANVDGKKGNEMLAISDLSGRLVVYTLAQAKREEEAPTSQLVTYPFEKTGSDPQPDLVVADFDGDQRDDVAVAHSDAARILLYRQRSAEGLDQGESFPGMLGVRALRALDFNRDGRIELFALSDREKTIGYSQFADGRLTFPSSIPTEGEPVAMELIDDLKAKTVTLLYLARVRDQQSFSDKYFLRAVRPESAKDRPQWSASSFDDKKELAITLPSKPDDLRAVDVNADGRADLLFLMPFDPPMLWLANGKGSYEQAPQSSQGTLGAVSSAAVYYGPLEANKPALVVAQNNFARSLKLDATGRWSMLDQFNAPNTNSSVLGVHALDLDDDGEMELSMYDRTGESVVFLKKREGVYRRWKELKVGVFALRGMRVADFDHDGKKDLLLFDADRMGIAYTAKPDLELKQIAGYETDIRNGRLFDMVPGDVNGDHKLDIVLLEPVRHHLEIVAVSPKGELQRATRWKVFEEKTFERGIRAAGIEPREVVVDDLNADGLNDIVLLVHDRVLVYLQDPGQPPAASE